PRQASNARQPAFEDADDQQWKPLIDPMQVVRGIARSKALILSTTILGAALGVAIALSTPKKYEATAELIVDPRDLKLTDRDLTQNVVASDATLAIVENQVRVLTSGTVLNKVVDKLNLTNDPEFNGQGSGGLGVMSMIRS
ncbi:MAG: succinoglycan biosynthesis protein exop, partial [Mesorhizobium sp.]